MTTAPPRRPSAPPEPPHRRARYFRVPRRRRVWPAALGWTLFAIVGVAAAAAVAGYVYLGDTIASAVPDTPAAQRARAATLPVLPGEPTNILLIGSDKRPGPGDPGRSDTIMLVRMDPQRNFISMLSFPRDLYVPIPGYGTDKINAAYSHGADVSIKTVEQLTGQPVNKYMIVDFTGFANLVDALGGVYLDIDRRYYNKNVGTAATNYANIDLQPGYQRLNGSNALAYVRYRHTDTTYARDARQQLFLSELKRQTKDIGNLTSIGTFRSIFHRNIEWNISGPQEFISLLQEALVTPKDRIARTSIQGRDAFTAAGASIQVATPQAVATAVQQWREPQFVRPTDTTAKPKDPASVHVTVFNGSGRVLAAEDVAQALGDKRYATSMGGNAPTLTHEVSQVYYAPGFADPARRIADLLGPNATFAEGPTNGADVAVITGKDWPGHVFAPPPPPKQPPSRTISTTSLVSTLRAVHRQVPGLKIMVPLKLAAGSSVKIVRPYMIENRRDRQSLKMVFRTNPGGVPRYWGIEMTQMRNPPILDGQTGVISSGGRRYLTYYDGKNLQRLAFQVGGTTYWISNTLANDLSAGTIQEIAKSMRPLNRASLPRGQRNTPVAIETAGRTP